MSRVSLELPPYVFKEYEDWGEETKGDTPGAQRKPARAMMLIVLQTMADRRIQDRRATQAMQAAAPRSPLLGRDGKPLRQAPTLLVPAARAKVVPLRRKP